MPRDLRETVRRSPGIKGWVRSLEEPVRQFLAAARGGDAGCETDEFEEVEDESDVSDDEVVFVGRRGGAAAARDRARPDGWKRAHREVHDRPIDRGMIFDSLEDDESGAFKYVLYPFPASQLVLLGNWRTRTRLTGPTGDGSPIPSLTTMDSTRGPSRWANRLGGVSTLASGKPNSGWHRKYGQSFLVRCGSSSDCMWEIVHSLCGSTYVRWCVSES